MRIFAPFAVLLLWLLASCASSPASIEDANWLDQKALRSCLLGINVPIEMIRDRNFQNGSVSLEIDVLPSGKIESVSVISGSGDPAFDKYLVDRLSNLQCAPFASIESSEPYSVNLELNIQVER